MAVEDEVVDDVGVGLEVALLVGVCEGVGSAVTLLESDALGVGSGVPLLDPVPLALAPCDKVVVGVFVGDDERLAVVEADSVLDGV